MCTRINYEFCQNLKPDKPRVLKSSFVEDTTKPWLSYTNTDFDFLKNSSFPRKTLSFTGLRTCARGGGERWKKIESDIFPEWCTGFLAERENWVWNYIEFPCTFQQNWKKKKILDYSPDFKPLVQLNQENSKSLTKFLLIKFNFKKTFFEEIRSARSTKSRKF